MIVSPLVLSLVLAADGGPAPKLPLGKDTTYVTGPLDKDGYIDYEAALNDRLGKDITPDRNAAVLIWKALGPTPEYGKRLPAEFFKRLGMEEPPKDGDYFVGLHAFVEQNPKLDPSRFQGIDDQRTRACKGPWAAKDYPHIAEWLKVNEKPLALVMEASRRPDYYNPETTHWRDEKRGPLNGLLWPGAYPCLECARALTARAMLRTEEGKFDDAWQDLLASHRLGRLVGRGGTAAIEGLDGIGIDRIASNADLAYLERADLTSKQIQDRQKDLQSLPPTSSLADIIDLGERFTQLDNVQLVRRGGIGMFDAIVGVAPSEELTKREEKQLALIDWAPALREVNGWYDREAAALRLKDRAERVKEIDNVEKEYKTLEERVSTRKRLIAFMLTKDPPDQTIGKEIGDAVIGLSQPVLSKVQSAYDRDEQVQRNLQVAFALAAYRRDHGNYPAKLDDLAPKYLPAVPDDVFSGGPLIYRPSDKGYVLYSVGVNGRDDGGRSAGDDPPGDDLPVAMPLPELKAKK